jgi:uncharacterized RDD family membrane protein YckC
MGAVYEAEEIASGRRVALKVLSHSLDSATTRQRFLREGRLAASVNHPNSVYIFGTEEIEGQPVITMELATGGTLQDRVKQSGPLAIPDAVDAILQVIAGLEAAARIGVLHRDVKPSNCFVEEDGTIKVGDFGLSISTLARPESNLTVTGAFLGTPAYSSPEQLRGDELDVRSDIYAVGVTLYYLLAGKTPFTGENVVQLLAQVLERAPESPLKLRPELPKELSNVVLRCLAKLPAQRFATYQDLREALAPFGSATDTPAPLTTRFCAGTLDACVDSIIQVLILLVLLPKSLILSGTSVLTFRHPWFQAIGPVIMTVLYYGVPEGLWGASLGKAVCNLRVLNQSRCVPGLARAFLRAAVFAAAFDLAANNEFYGSHRYLELFTIPAFSLGLFATARKANGWAGLHDLASKTRVVRKRATESRPAIQKMEAAPPQIEGSAQIGPYHVLSRLDESVGCELLLGYDTRLLRKVWIYKQSAGTPLGIHRHALRRPTRLRWLNGQLTQEGSWDAYEAPTGEAFLQSLHSPKPWEGVRYWLNDLAQEMGAALKDSSLPPAVEMNRVWLTSDGRAKLLEFPAPGAGCAQGATAPDQVSCSAPFGSDDAQLFLKQVAASALAGRPLSTAEIPQGPVAGVLPLPTRNFLGQLPHFPDLDQTIAQLTPLLHQATAISRARRLGLMAACCLPATLLMAMMCFLLVFMQKYSALLGDSQQDLVSLGYCVDRFETLEKAARTDANQSEREALEIYIAARSTQLKTNQFVSNALEKSKENKVKELNQIINQIQAKHPAPSVQEIADATARLKPFLDACPPYPGAMISQKFRVEIITMLPYGFALLVAVPSLLAALICRGGLLLRVLGVDFVARDGAPASRWRLVARILLTWSLLLVFTALSPVLGPFKAEAIMLALFALGVTFSLLDPQRSLPDRLAGTWPVPR